MKTQPRKLSRLHYLFELRETCRLRRLRCVTLVPPSATLPRKEVVPRAMPTQNEDDAMLPVARPGHPEDYRIPTGQTPGESNPPNSLLNRFLASEQQAPIPSPHRQAVRFAFSVVY